MMTSMCHLQDIFGLSRGSDLILKVVVLLSLFLWVDPEVRTMQVRFSAEILIWLKLLCTLVLRLHQNDLTGRIIWLMRNLPVLMIQYTVMKIYNILHKTASFLMYVSMFRFNLSPCTMEMPLYMAQGGILTCFYFLDILVHVLYIMHYARNILHHALVNSLIILFEFSH